MEPKKADSHPVA